MAAVGACFGQDVGVGFANPRIIARLLAEQLPDGGWNCDAADGSTRSSFNTTICVLEALLEHERAGGGATEHAGEINLKDAMMPVVSFARLYALRHQINQTHTTAQTSLRPDRRGAEEG